LSGYINYIFSLEGEWEICLHLLTGKSQTRDSGVKYTCFRCHVTEKQIPELLQISLQNLMCGKDFIKFPEESPEGQGMNSP
jgi:hypothetical protein